MRSMVEGLNSEDVIEHGLSIVQHLDRRNPDHPISMLVQPFVPPRIPPRSVAHRVRHPVDLDDQLPARAIEVGDKGSHRMLAAEFQSLWSITQHLPEHRLGWASFPGVACEPSPPLRASSAAWPLHRPTGGPPPHRFGDREERLAYRPSMFSGLTTRSNVASSTRPSSSPASLRVRPFSWAYLAILAAWS